jgi:hypothetical protein
MTSADKRKKTSAQTVFDTNAGITIFKTLADTTWRMFIPPAVGAVIGLQLEAQGLHQVAVWGAIIGVIISGLLVWQQYRSVNDEGKKS